MSEAADELWALGSGGQVFTENGRLIATFVSETDAKAIIDDHNIEVELSLPEPPEVKKSHEEQQAARLAAYREEDPAGYRCLNLVIAAASRAMRLISLKAPPFIVADQINSLSDRVAILQKMHPVPADEAAS